MTPTPPATRWPPSDRACRTLFSEPAVHRSKQFASLLHQENADKGNVVAQSQGVNPVALALWNMLVAQTNSPHVRVRGSYAASASSAFAFFRSRVSWPSVNQP